MGRGLLVVVALALVGSRGSRSTTRLYEKVPLETPVDIA